MPTTTRPPRAKTPKAPITKAPISQAPISQAPITPIPIPVPSGPKGEATTTTGLRLRTFRPAPAGFDAQRATARQLVAHGIPRRPDPETEPAARRAWDRAMSRATTWITPEFVEVPGHSHGPARAGRTVRAPKELAREDGVRTITDGTSSNWSGAVDFSGKGTPFTWVAGQWTVPNPHDPTDGDVYASEWIGIDGWGSGDVLQAGTETHVWKFLWFSGTSVYTWFEWFPAGEVAISNLDVSAGDVMYCLICVTSTTTAQVHFSNQSTGVTTSFSMTAPQGTTLVGNSAEWVVERPGINGSVAALTDYDVVYFDECLAGWAGNNRIGVDDLSVASPITMTTTGDSSGAVLSSPTIENDHLLKLTWERSS